MRPMQLCRRRTKTTGKLVLKPVALRSTKLDPVATTIIVASVLIVLAAAWLGGRMKLFESLIPLAVGLLLISPPLALGGYTILRNDELGAVQRRALYIRSALCALAYVVLWGVFHCWRPRACQRRICGYGFSWALPFFRRAG